MNGVKRTGRVVSRRGRVHILEDLAGRRYRAEADIAWPAGRWVLTLDGVIVAAAGNVPPAVVVIR